MELGITNEKKAKSVMNVEKEDTTTHKRWSYTPTEQTVFFPES